MTNEELKKLINKQTSLIEDLSEKLNKKDFDKLIEITKLEAEININKVKKIFGSC
jgi:ribosomal protein L18E